MLHWSHWASLAVHKCKNKVVGNFTTELQSIKLTEVLVSSWPWWLPWCYIHVLCYGNCFQVICSCGTVGWCWLFPGSSVQDQDCQFLSIWASSCSSSHGLAFCTAWWLSSKTSVQGEPGRGCIEFMIQLWKSELLLTSVCWGNHKDLPRFQRGRYRCLDVLLEYVFRKPSLIASRPFG